MKLRFLLLICAVFPAFPYQGVAGDYVWTNEASFFTDYYSRGISQTKGQAAPQLLSIVFNKQHGLYAGAFVSRVEFNDNDAADLEVDFFFGLKKFIKHWSYRAGLIRYTYPNADNRLKYNFVEFDAGVGYKFNPVYIEASLKYSPNYFFDTGEETYSKVEIEAPVTQKFTLKGHIAYRSIEDEARFGVPNNYDWGLAGVYAAMPTVDVSLKYVGSTLGKEDGCIDICDGRVIVGLTYKF